MSFHQTQQKLTFYEVKLLKLIFFSQQKKSTARWSQRGWTPTNLGNTCEFPPPPRISMATTLPRVPTTARGPPPSRHATSPTREKTRRGFPSWRTLFRSAPWSAPPSWRRTVCFVETLWDKFLSFYKNC